MVNFYNDYVTCSEKATISDVAGELQGQPSPSANHCEGPTSQQHLVFSLIPSSLTFAADHFDHLKKIGGPEIIGFGGDYDGVTR